MGFVLGFTFSLAGYLVGHRFDRGSRMLYGLLGWGVGLGIATLLWSLR